MKVEFKKIADLKDYEYNSRTHSQEQVDQIAESMKEVGWTNPILIDENNGIIAGHGRKLAALKLGKTEAPCIVLAGLSDVQKKAYVIADNQLALNAGWDYELLQSEIEYLIEEDFNIDLIGFDQSFMYEICEKSDFLPGSELDQGNLDSLEPKMVTCPHCKKMFDLRDSEDG